MKNYVDFFYSYVDVLFENNIYDDEFTRVLPLKELEKWINLVWKWLVIYKYPYI